jgi:integrase
MIRASIYRRCACADPATGKQYGTACPYLSDPRHGTWGYSTRLDTTKGRRQLKRHGFATKKAARAAVDQVDQLMRLACDDPDVRARIGDHIFSVSSHGRPLPDVDDVRTRIMAGGTPAHLLNVGGYLSEWLASKRGVRASTLKSYREHIELYLRPHLADIRLDHLRASHIDAMFEATQDERDVSHATLNRVYATLRNALNAAVKRRLIPFNPIHGVDPFPESVHEAQVWDPEQVDTFLRHAHAADERLWLAYRLVLLCGLRRGEMLGLRRAGLNLDQGTARITRTVGQLGGKIVHGTPKTRSGERWVHLDTESVALLKAGRRKVSAERLAFGPAYQDDDLVFAHEDGTVISPERASRRFRQLAKDAGLLVIRLHDGRHTAATLGLEAGVPMKVVSELLGHSRESITSQLYTHVRPAVRSDAVERVAALVARKG